MNQLKFNIAPKIGLEHTIKFSESTDKLDKLITGASPRAILNLKKEILDSLDKSNNFESVINTSRKLRILLRIWIEDQAFFKKLPFKKKLIKNLLKPDFIEKQRVIRTLIEFYLCYFDEIDGYEELSDLIKFQLARLNTQKKLTKKILFFFNNKHIIFSEEGPNKIISEIFKQNKPPEKLIKILNVPERSRYKEILLAQYFLTPIKTKPLKSLESFLAEIRKTENRNIYIKDGIELRHKVCSIIIKRTTEEETELLDFCKNAILDLLGDPRRYTGSIGYNETWGRMSQQEVNAMRGWLSNVDLQLFLEIFEEFGQIEQDEKFQRMYPPRKTFLEGLLKEKVVYETRLLLRSKTISYLEKSYNKNELPEYSILKDSNCDAIYLKIGTADSKTAYIIEGTNSFSMRIYEDVPDEGLVNYQKNEFRLARFNNSTTVESISHLPSYWPKWQKKALDCLYDNFGIEISPKNVLTDDDYKSYLTLPKIRT